MPELPEVETTCKGIAPSMVGFQIESLVVRDRRLRWPVPANLESLAANQSVVSVSRRAKYVLIELASGTLIIHLGMSGSMRVIKNEHSSEAEIKKHDHFDFTMSNGHIVRYNDPRRFGCLLWVDQGATHRLLKNLGPEPLCDEFDGAYLFRQSRNRNVAIKIFIMNQAVVVGVGNIYASESLFIAGISPEKPAAKVSCARYQKLATAIKTTLKKAIEAGGTSLRDFTDSDGKPGYFKQELMVYGREAETCVNCQTVKIAKIVQGQRATYYCKRCQT